MTTLKTQLKNLNQEHSNTTIGFICYYDKHGDLSYVQYSSQISATVKRLYRDNSNRRTSLKIAPYKWVEPTTIEVCEWAISKLPNYQSKEVIRIKEMAMKHNCDPVSAHYIENPDENPYITDGDREVDFLGVYNDLFSSFTEEIEIKKKIIQLKAELRSLEERLDNTVCNNKHLTDKNLVVCGKVMGFYPFVNDNCII
jgi:hypothetical protein